MKNKAKQNQTEKIFLFPGEGYKYNEKLLSTDAFGFNNNRFIAKRFGVLNYNLENEKPGDDVEEESFRGIGKYYSPRLDDFVIGTIIQKSNEMYRVDIGTYTGAILPTNEFEGATKKTKPNLNLGDVVFARVSRVNKYDAPLLSCISQISSKNWSSGESFFGNLKGGNIFNFPKNSAWDFYKEDNVVIKELTAVIDFHFVFGMNGKVWTESSSPKTIMQIYDIFMQYFKFSQDERDNKIKSLIQATFNKDL